MTAYRASLCYDGPRYLTGLSRMLAMLDPRPVAAPLVIFAGGFVGCLTAAWAYPESLLWFLGAMVATLGLLRAATISVLPALIALAMAIAPQVIRSDAVVAETLLFPLAFLLIFAVDKIGGHRRVSPGQPT